jgi:hypothetical protein
MVPGYTRVRQRYAATLLLQPLSSIGWGQDGAEAIVFWRVLDAFLNPSNIQLLDDASVTSVYNMSVNNEDWSVMRSFGATHRVA